MILNFSIRSTQLKPHAANGPAMEVRLLRPSDEHIAYSAIYSDSCHYTRTTDGARIGSVAGTMPFKGADEGSVCLSRSTLKVLALLPSYTSKSIVPAIVASTNLEGR